MLHKVTFSINLHRDDTEGLGEKALKFAQRWLHPQSSQLISAYSQVFSWFVNDFTLIKGASVLTSAPGGPRSPRRPIRPGRPYITQSRKSIIYMVRIAPINPSYWFATCNHRYKHYCSWSCKNYQNTLFMPVLFTHTDIPPHIYFHSEPITSMNNLNLSDKD